MTPEEQEDLTKQAMERAQKARPEVTEPKKAPGHTVLPETTKPKKVKPTKPAEKTQIQKLQDNQRKLGERTVTLKPWAGRTKKKFKKEFEFAESIQDVDLKKIIEILVYDQIEEDYQLSEMELQYLLAELKAMSIGSEIECSMTCPQCSAENKITGSTEDGVFKEDKLPAKFKDWNFKNIKRSEFIKTKNAIMNADDYDGLSTETDIELASKITKQDRNAKQMLDIMDDTPLKELTEMMDEYVKNLAFYDIKIKKTCTSCQEEVMFDADIITGIFETMAK